MGQFVSCVANQQTFFFSSLYPSSSSSSFFSSVPLPLPCLPSFLFLHHTQMAFWPTHLPPLSLHSTCALSFPVYPLSGYPLFSFFSTPKCPFGQHTYHLCPSTLPVLVFFHCTPSLFIPFPLSSVRQCAPFTTLLTTIPLFLFLFFLFLFFSNLPSYLPVFPFGLSFAVELLYTRFSPYSPFLSCCVSSLLAPSPKCTQSASFPYNSLEHPFPPCGRW